MEAKDPSAKNLHLHAVMMLQIQLDLNAGSALLFIGNSDVSSSNHMVVLVAGQAFSVGFVGGNALYTPSIWLQSDTDNVNINLAVVIS